MPCQRQPNMLMATQKFVLLLEVSLKDVQSSLQKTITSTKISKKGSTSGNNFVLLQDCLPRC